MARGMPLKNLFQAMAVRLNGPRADGRILTLNLDFTDLDEPHLLVIENSVLHVFANRQDASADATLSLASLNFKRLMLGVTTAEDLLREKQLRVTGDLKVLEDFSGLFHTFVRRFPIVTPRSPG